MLRSDKDGSAAWPWSRALALALIGAWSSGCGDDFATFDPEDVAIDAIADVAVVPSCSSDADCGGAKGPCEVARCLSTGVCAIALKSDGSACDDGEACTEGTTCAQGACQGGWNSCPCKVAEGCESAYGDGDPCNGTLYCDEGASPPACVVNPASVPDCSGGSTCAPEACDAKTGKCVATSAKDGTDCDDGEPCTKGDTCIGGACVAGPSVCACQTTADCAAQEDGDLCNGTLYCDTSSFPPTCKTNPTTVITCKDDGLPCTSVGCDKAKGACVATPLPKGASCTDGDPCTAGDACEAGVCQPGAPSCACKVDADCAKHEDGDLCNGTLYCDTSAAPFACKVNPKTVVSCDTSVDTACAKTSCDPKTGSCASAPVSDGAPCQDGDVCTQGDSCAKGDCKPGKNLCACQADSDCAAFEDGDLCNGSLYCDKSAAPFVCKVNGATKVVCNPAKDSACVMNTCAPKTGTCAPVALPDGATCDGDGNPCTANDACKTGLCAPDPINTCECTKDADCGAFDDGNACNGTLYCDTSPKDPKDFRCKVNPTTVVTCNKASDTECSIARCQPKTGTCGVVTMPEGAQCNADNDICTAGDVCKAGTCVAGQSVCACTSDADCASKSSGACDATYYCDKSGGAFTCKPDPATATTCKLPSGVAPGCAAVSCVEAGGKATCPVSYADAGVGCDDGDPGTYGDVCDGKGHCQGGGAPCTSHADCLALEKDKDLCNGGLRCLDAGGAPVATGMPGTCTTVNAPVACPPGTPCEPLACAPALGLCLPDASTDTTGQPCDDGDKCSSMSACVGGACKWVQAFVDCDDGNSCTDDLCTPEGGCNHKPAIGALCSDGNPCTVGDVCDQKGCMAGTLPPCADGDACTLDTCDPKTGGCTHTVQTACATCKKASDCDKEPCATASCKAGTCDYTPSSGAPCVDGDPCTQETTCDKGLCKGGKPVVCNDNNPCTSDSCAGGCVFKKTNGGSCSDGDSCTTVDTCAEGKCLGKPKVCNDDKPCTQDSCSGGSCVFENHKDGTQCTDGKACTSGDACKAGKCIGLSKLCNDFDSCTTDSCDPASGNCVSKPIAGCAGCEKAKDCDDKNPCTTNTCVNKGCKTTMLNQGSCDDGDKCTPSSSCVSGQCKGKPKTCIDTNPCTKDSCDPSKGCVHTAQSGGSCSDGNKCTSEDTCKAGKCKGTAKSCNDGKACTLDVCDKNSGACKFSVSTKACEDGNPCTTAGCDATGACVQTPTNEGKTCDSAGNLCASGSCGSCGLWSVSHVAATTATNSAYFAVHHTSGSEVVFGGGAVRKSAGYRAWFNRAPTSSGKASGGYFTLTVADARITGLAANGGGHVLGVTAPVGGNFKPAHLLRWKVGKNMTTGDLSNLDFGPGAGIQDIAQLKVGNRWAIARDYAKGSTYAAYLDVVDAKAKDHFGGAKKLGDDMSATGVTQLKDGTIVVSVTPVGFSGGAAGVHAYTTKGKKAWSATASTKTGFAFNDVVQGDDNEAVLVGEIGVGGNSAKPYLRAQTANKTVWVWSGTAVTAGVATLRGAAPDGAKGVVAVGDITTLADTRGLVVRVDTDGKLVWRREVPRLGIDAFSAVSVSGTHLVAVGATAATPNSQAAWALRMKLDGTLYCGSSKYGKAD